ncbi:MAG TPA: sugar transferase [Fimbriimonadaceae bacterium]|nr:sugar transferase [Fimbriimonadaceae bacterium]
MQDALKRLIDMVGAFVGLVVFSPVLLVVAILVRIKLGSPVFFVQERPGLNGKPFNMIKFRTMRSGSGSDEERMSRLGQVLRATSLDELPELFNVLKGEMSLVGPRPLLMKYLNLYTPEQSRRHEVRPGITGWAQVNGRNRQSWDDRFALDIWYVNNRKLGLDLKILLMTVLKVVKRDGVAADGHVTMPEFTGSKSG